MKKTAKIIALLAFLLLVASFPTCRHEEHIVQAELVKLSAAERAMHEFDLKYVQLVLPGILMFFAGIALGFLSIVLWIVGLVADRKPG